ncbi:subtilisin protease SBT4.14 [Trifolium repens]|nr:subtilisin protease SBT4.14 [Trifolium repens]
MILFPTYFCWSIIIQSRVLNPGLIYDMDELGYVQFLCHEVYNDTTLSILIGSPINCTSLVHGFGHDAINYPSMQLSAKNNTESTIGVFSRTVTNVSK